MGDDVGRARAAALRELREQFALPESYGETTVIDGERTPPEMPAGPMEKLLDKPVSLHMVNVDLQKLLLKLGKIDKLNLIADDSLRAASTITLQVDDVPLHEVFSYVARNMGLNFHIGVNTVWVTKAEEGNGELITRVYPLSHGMVPHAGAFRNEKGRRFDKGAAKRTEQNTDLVHALSTFVKKEDPPGADYSFYANHNTLVVRNTRENLRLVERLIRALDRPPLQVLIETRFVRISQEDLFQLGMDLSAQSGGNTAGEGDLDLQIASNLTSSANAGTLDIGGIIGDTEYQLMLQALESMKSTETLSVPRVTVLNNHLASLDDSKKEYYFNEYDLATIDQGDEGTLSQLVPVGHPEELDIGIALDVIPSIGNNGRTVTLHLAPRVTDSEQPFGVRNLRSEEVKKGKNTETVISEGYIQVPSFIESSVTTTVAVDSGQTVLLGGSMSTKEQTIERKFPLLGDVPWLGELFRYNEDLSSPENLLIFVTATVIGPDGRFVETNLSP